MDDSYTLTTPEQVDLAYDVAGLGTRFLALVLDSLIQFAVLGALAVVGIISGGVSSALVARGRSVDPGFLGMSLLALTVITMFLVLWGYFIFFEMAWNGQTPGKRALGLRVLTAGGRPITLTHALIRNLIRIVDFLPTSYLIGALTILITPASQRLGDLAAGTLVVKVRSEAVPTILPASNQPPLSPVEAERFSSDEVALARDFLLRRYVLSTERRSELAGLLAARFRPRLDRANWGEPAEVLLERVASLRR